MSRSSSLPSSVLPRGLSRKAAAEYCGMAVSTFDARVKEGSLPGPMFPGRGSPYDRLALDRALNFLSGLPEESANAAEEAALKAIWHGGGKRALRG